MKLWDKGFSINALTEEFTVGKDRELDLMLAKADVMGNMAQLKMLRKIDLLSQEEYNSIHVALQNIGEHVLSGDFAIADTMEDIHSQIEYLLTEQCGEAGKKIHTGRSRNDQVLTDLKLFTREEMLEVVQLVDRLFDLWIKKAGDTKDILIPGYTHLQVAMPSSFGMWYSAYAESLADDLLFVKAAYDGVNTNPLGTGAGYGSSIPLDRAYTTTLLAFDDIAYNPIYAQMQRGKMEKQVLFALAAIATTVGRFAADVCMYSCSNFQFIKLPDQFTTGSSIMPHKKNPDIFELIRAKCNKIQALPTQLAMIGTNLTSGYFRDMQVTKEIYLPAFKEMKDILTMLITVVEQMQEQQGVTDAEIYDPLFTVESVNALVAQGVPFRDAYKQVGAQVMNKTFQADRSLAFSHTHEGSIGNLCLEQITARYKKHRSGWNDEVILNLYNQLMK
ncbi:MAG: argininosuccinate lyase [Marinifilaceae bacterium]